MLLIKASHREENPFNTNYAKDINADSFLYCMVMKIIQTNFF